MWEAVRYSAQIRATTRDNVGTRYKCHVTGVQGVTALKQRGAKKVILLNLPSYRTKCN